MIPTTSRMAADPLRRRPRCRCPAGGSSPPTRPSPSPAASSCSNFDLSRGMDFGYCIYIYIFLIYIYIFICIIWLYIYIYISLYAYDCICRMRFYRMWSWVNYSGRNDCFFLGEVTKHLQTKHDETTNDMQRPWCLFCFVWSMCCILSLSCHYKMNFRSFSFYDDSTILALVGVQLADPFIPSFQV